jgi:hypothetical protein
MPRPETAPYLRRVPDNDPKPTVVVTKSTKVEASQTLNPAQTLNPGSVLPSPAPQTPAQLAASAATTAGKSDEPQLGGPFRDPPRFGEPAPLSPAQRDALAIAPAPPPSNRTAAHRFGAVYNPELGKKYGHLIHKFEALGLPTYAATMFATYLVQTDDDAANLGGTQVALWLETFKATRPVAYFDARNGNLLGFISKVKLYGLDVLEPGDFQKLSQAVGTTEGPKIGSTRLGEPEPSEQRGDTPQGANRVIDRDSRQGEFAPPGAAFPNR